ncbi:hypothetical protein C7999DRAFT_39164 [Corynascus novoguineensis]|uniref:Uncharacterized protein n=1 Tax=Corynascus novoguineensis TaxID=1126955 RepID=A0AAN7CXF5_9PEZI|nr:hypothetical protein C7999DRAFT_39164 [Corynascus novoguineensis]
MLSVLQPFLVIALGLSVQGVKGGRNEDKHSHSTCTDGSTVHECVTVYDTKTVELTHYVNVTVDKTRTNTIETCITESTTTTLHYTVSVTQTAIVTVTDTDTDSVIVTNTATNSTTLTNTETESTTVTNTESVTTTDTETTTAIVPTTTYTTRTVFSTTFDPCPKSCSISAETVNLYFWPTNRPFTYPSTYVHPELSYTFTSPSVYMLIPTAVGVNTAGQTAGPSTSRWILPLDADDVSTIAPGLGGNVTRQLRLADLGTDCPQTAEPTAIASMAPDPRCDPVLAAPSQVRSWAYPCNACGRFGLFDPPYAVPTLTGSLVEPPPPLPTTTTETTVVGPISTATTADDGTDTPPSAPSTGTSVAPPSQAPTGVTTSSVLGSTVTSVPGATTSAGIAGLWLIPAVGVVIAML